MAQMMEDGSLLQIVQPHDLNACGGRNTEPEALLRRPAFSHPGARLARTSFSDQE